MKPIPVHALCAVAAAGMFIAAGLASPVRAETVDCTPIPSLPYTISAQGIYCLTANLATSQASGSAITIAANNVTLDLNGWKVGGQAAGTGTGAVGISSAANNVTIKNGIVRGFMFGMYLTGRGATVQGITADQNTSIGIYVGGPGSVVQGNQVVDTGGSSLYSNVFAVGIDVYGSGTLVQNNLVSGLTATGNDSEWGIYVDSAAPQSTARGNVVSDTARTAGGSYGIYINSTAAVAASNNIVTNFDIGVDYYSGATGTYSRNTAIGCTTAYSGGTVGSGND